MTFTSYAQGGNFDPIRRPDYLPGMEENYRREEASMEAYGQAERENDQVRIANAKRAGDDMIALGKLSKTLSKVLYKEAERQNEEDLNEGIAMAYEEGMYGAGSPERMALDAGEAQLKADDAELGFTAGLVMQGNGDNYQAARSVRNMSGWKRYGYATGKAQVAGMQYGSWMENAMSTDDQTVINVGGESFTPAQAYTPQQKQAAMAVLRRQYMSQSGVSGLAKPLLAKYMFESMMKSDAAMIGQARKEYAISESRVEAGEADNALFATKDLGTYLTSLAGTVDGNGNARGYAGAWPEAMTRMENAIKAGLLSEADLTVMEGQIQPGTGKSFGELHRTKFALLRQNIQDAETNNFNREQGSRKLERQKAEQQIVDELIKLPNMTDADVEAAEDKLDEIYPGIDSARLNNLKTNQTLDAQQTRAQEKEVEQLADAGLLTPERLAKYHWKIQQKFQGVAAQQKQLQPELKQFNDAIESEVKRIAGVTPQSAKNGSVVIMVAKAQADFKQIAASHMQGGKSAQEAASLAYAEISQRLEAGKTKASTQPNNPYASNHEGYPNIIPNVKSVQSGVESTNAEIQETTSRIYEAGGKVGLFNVKNLLFTDEQLEKMGTDIQNGTFTVPPRAAYYAQTYGFNDPIELINAQRKASGMEEIAPPQSVETIRQTVDPEFQKFLYDFPTEPRQTRALSQVGKYEASIVPKGYGSVIQSAAQTHGIDPSILAGLIETESAWNPAAVSRAGAVGLGQFMPETAAQFGVDRRDPTSSINGAAKYLAYLRDYFKGDMNKAIYAYNGGMGNIETYGGPIPGNAENQGYLSKVMRSASKYGYGQLPVRAAYKPENDQAVYTSGNIGPTSTGQHLDVKQVGRGRFHPKALDNYVVVDDPELGRVPLGSVPITGDFDSHTVRGSHGIDYGLYSGTKIYLRNGARVVGTRPSVHGDVLTIALPNGTQYTFLHGTSG